MSPVNLPRRQLLVGAVSAIAMPPLASLARADTSLILTPGQTEGPFYPVTLPADRDADLVRVQGQAAQAVGQVTHISGRVLDRRGGVVRDALVEIWQCDANGIYNHPQDRGQDRRDAAFQGYGRAQVDQEGRYAFRTIRPVAYPGRTPHIHYKIHAPNAGTLTTQMYVAGEPQNARDGILRSIRDARARESVIVRLGAAAELEPGALKGTFDIVLDL
ncbi:MAG: intradiol ring-cleavage dioxygenase [Hyphomicrobiaceae bacterium]|nr:MAG: intradiol ring-cleavage dioxygenase [Hyphomicrobiaceae bacterium]